jgi:hypothetical protein
MIYEIKIQKARGEERRGEYVRDSAALFHFPNLCSISIFVKVL